MRSLIYVDSSALLFQVWPPQEEIPPTPPQLLLYGHLVGGRSASLQSLKEGEKQLWIKLHTIDGKKKNCE